MLRDLHWLHRAGPTSAMMMPCRTPLAVSLRAGLIDDLATVREKENRLEIGDPPPDQFGRDHGLAAPGRRDQEQL